MKKIEASCGVEKELLEKSPDVNKAVARDLCISFANEMHKIGKLNINVSEDSYDRSKKIFKIKGFVMTEDEFIELKGDLLLIKEILPCNSKYIAFRIMLSRLIEKLGD